MASATATGLGPDSPGTRALGLMTEEFGAYSTVFVRRQLEALSELQPFVACWVRSNPEVFDHEAIHVLRSESPLRRACAQLLSHLPNRFTLWQRILAAGEMRRLLRRYRPRHLLIHFGWAAARVVGVLEEEGVPFTLFFHGSDLNEAHAHPEPPLCPSPAAGRASGAALPLCKP
jgi:hypothetical protein